MSQRRSERLSSNKKKQACKSIEETGILYLDHAFEEEFELSNQVISSLSKSVVSVASFIENQMHVACTGIVVESDRSDASILTSASLIRSLDPDNELKMFPHMTIKVCLPNNQEVFGSVVHYDFNFDIVVVKINPYPAFEVSVIDPHMQFGSNSKVVGLGRCFNIGKLMASCGIVTDEPRGVYPEHLMISTCKITRDMTGGPLVDLDGNFVGMNFYSEDRSPFLPRKKIFDLLNHACVVWFEMRHKGRSTIERSTCEIQKSLTPVIPNVEGTFSEDDENKNQKLSISSSSDSEGESEFLDEEPQILSEFIKPLPDDDFTEHMRKDLKPRNYPMPIFFESGMRLINTFEEEFTEDAWSKLNKKVASSTSRSVVALASFKGEERFFACTGSFIDFKGSTSRVLTSASLVRTSANENKVDDTLKIQIRLPNKRLVSGTLEYCNLSYNIAVVSVIGFRSLRTVEFHDQMQIEPHREVLAIGRGFESGKLMVTSGILTDKESKLDCKELMMSTCKITKAGIGGPLIDLDGNFIGMNFYGRKKTYYLPRSMILTLLRHFEGPATDEVIHKSNRWAVPKPRWYYPSMVRQPVPCGELITLD